MADSKQSSDRKQDDLQRLLLGTCDEAFQTFGTDSDGDNKKN